MARDYSLSLLNENSLALHFHIQGNLPTAELCDRIAYCKQAILDRHPAHILDAVASYNSLLIYYDFTQLNGEQLRQDLEAICQASDQANTHNTNTTKEINIPVYYSEESGPDLSRLSQLHGLSTNDIITRHTQKTYTVYAVGFLPGFAYLGFVDQDLRTPRLSTPRKKVPQGAVGIADQQTGIYPSDSPGGWNIIGRSPMAMLDQTKNENINLLNTGDRVRFYAISRETFFELGGALT